MQWTVSRNSSNIFGNWWWTVDRVLLFAITALFAIGAVLIFTASPPVALRVHFGFFHYIQRQFMFIPVAYLLMLAVSMQNLKTIRRISVLVFVTALALMIFIMFTGGETKGAARWIKLCGFSLQPSEFIKPAFAVLAAWLFDAGKKTPDFPGYALSTLLFALIAALLISQPDIGMTIVVSLVWAFQLFLAGIPWILILLLIALFAAFVFFAYITFDHVHIRVQQFLSAENDLSYQVKNSLEAFKSGGFFGRGPGEGIVKFKLPDAHTDFIFPVAGEEFGTIFCLIIVTLFAIIVIRSMMLSKRENNLFLILATSGLAASFGLQGIINMASALNLMPTKGMTLPLISYGGSSLLASALLLGILLAITRKNVFAEDQDNA